MALPIAPFVLDLETGEISEHPRTPAWRRSPLMVAYRRDIDIQCARLGIEVEEVVVDGKVTHLDEATVDLLKQVAATLAKKEKLPSDPERLEPP
jgi:hypothetical protein